MKPRFFWPSEQSMYGAGLLARVFDVLVEQPLWILYRRGPYPCWQGKSSESICAAMTNSPPEFWSAQQVECARIIQRQFQSMVVVTGEALYVLFMFKLIGAVWFRYMYMRPVMNELRRLQQASCALSNKSCGCGIVKL